MEPWAYDVRRPGSCTPGFRLRRYVFWNLGVLDLEFPKFGFLDLGRFANHRERFQFFLELDRTEKNNFWKNVHSKVLVRFSVPNSQASEGSGTNFLDLGQFRNHKEGSTDFRP